MLKKYTGTSKDGPILKKMLEELEIDDIVIVEDITRISEVARIC